MSPRSVADVMHIIEDESSGVATCTLAGNPIRFLSVDAIRNFVPTRLLRPKIFTREEGVGCWMLRGGRRWSPIAYATAIVFCGCGSCAAQPVARCCSPQIPFAAASLAAG